MNEIIYAGHGPRHDDAENAWEFVYCADGAGSVRVDQETWTYKKGDVVAMPPHVPHAGLTDKGVKNIHLNMRAPALSPAEPMVIPDSENHFLLDAFTAALYHFKSNGPERAALLSLYGSLICCYLGAYQTKRRRSRVVEEIEEHILLHYSDPGYELDVYLKSLPFNYDYLRKLFQKEMLVTPHQYLTSKRLQSAADALAGMGVKNGNITDIARMCGFREPLYFSPECMLMSVTRYGHPILVGCLLLLAYLFLSRGNRRRRLCAASEPFVSDIL